jgi:ABC-type uncharacterized transport system involved in gliding motility auxiliary subunit
MSWLSIKREGVSPTDVVTSTMNLLNLQSAGIIRPKDGSKLTFEPLITTTEESQAMDVAFINAPRPKIIEMWEAFKPSGERLVLAARLTGRTKSMFPDGPPKEKKEETKDEKAAKPKADKKPEVKADTADKSAPAAAKEDAKGTTEKAASEQTDEKKEEAKPVAPPFVAESTAPMNIILVADTDMLENRAWVQTREFFGQQVQLPFANNADFVVNVAENLAGGAALASLRSRGTARRPFTKIDDLRLAAENKFRTEERQLQNRLGDAEKKLDELRKKKKEGASVDTAVQAAVDEFTKEILGTRKELRRVQLALREDIEKLKGRLVFFNIALVPLLVGILALVLGALRIRRHRLATQAQEA